MVELEVVSVIAVVVLEQTARLLASSLSGLRDACESLPRRPDNFAVVARLARRVEARRRALVGRQPLALMLSCRWGPLSSLSPSTSSSLPFSDTLVSVARRTTEVAVSIAESTTTYTLTAASASPTTTGAATWCPITTTDAICTTNHPTAAVSMLAATSSETKPTATPAAHAARLHLYERMRWHA